MQEAQPQNSFDRALLSDIGIFIIISIPQHHPTQGNLRGGRRTSVKQSTLKNKYKKNPSVIIIYPGRYGFENKLGMRTVYE
jgi:hypothetical protein